MNNRLVRESLLVIGVAIVMWRLVKLAPSLVMLAVAIAAVFVAILWMLRYERQTLSRIYRLPGIRWIIDVVCRIAREQPPAEGADDDKLELLLTSEEQFVATADEIKIYVRGQDGVIDQLLRHLRDAILLRQRRVAAANDPPLGVFLLAGPEGVGKRYLARVLARLLFRNASTITFEMDKLGGSALTTMFGVKGSPGSLTEAVRRQPYHVVILERIEMAPSDVVAQLRDLFRNGVAADAASGRVLKFHNCVFVLTTAKGTAALTQSESQAISRSHWLHQAAEILSSEASLDDTLLASLTDIVCCRPPDDVVKAEIIAMLMMKECNSYGVTLDYVDPEIIAAQVSSLREELGLALAPDRISKLLRDPLVLAAERKRLRMALKVTASEPEELETSA